MTHTRYTPTDIHWRLIAARGDDDSNEDCTNQALHCPYYVTLEGCLGLDWGVIVNPESDKFAKLVFEHHSCGCPADEYGHPLHPMGDQAPDEWVAEAS